MYEGGDSEVDPYGEEQYGDEIDPEDPYQINRLNEIDHEILKEMYT